MTRLLALLVSTILLTACSSGADVLYTSIDGMAVIENETWSSKKDSAQFTWRETTSPDASQAAQLGARQSTAPVADTALATVATALYRIEFTGPNLYYVWVRGRVINEHTRASASTAELALTFTTNTHRSTWQIAGFNDQWQWIALDINQNVLSATVSEPGTFELGIATDTTHLLVDKIVFTDQPGYIPNGTGPVSTIIDMTIDTDLDAAADDGPSTDQHTISNSDENYSANNEASNNVSVNTETNDPDINTDTDTGAIANSDSEMSDVETSDTATSDSATNGSPITQDTGNDPSELEGATTDDSSISADDTRDQTDTSAPVEDQNSDTDDNEPVVTIDGANRVEAGHALTLAAATNNDSTDGPIYFFWDQISGAGLVQIDDNRSQSPSITFGLPGAYTIQVTATTDIGYHNAAVEITVLEASNTQNQPADDSANTTPTTNDNESSNVSLADQNIATSHQWRSASSSGSAAKRHETSGVAVNGKMYVIGGRGHQPIDVYDSATNSWSQAAKPPIEMHHFQAVAIDHVIYVIGAATCCYPVETNIPNIYQFDTRSGNWSKGAAIPDNRLRGSTAAAVYNRKIYIVGGNTKGHSGGAVSWFDEFDPATGQWRALADAPDARDHATIALVGDRLVVAGGRRSSYPNTFGNTVARTNVYNFSQQRWQTAANIPTERAGTMAVGLGSELVVIGGESLASSNAHNAVEAFNILSGTWRRLNPLPTPRHGGAAAVINQSIHVVAGSKQRGGAPETEAHEILK